LSAAASSSTLRACAPAMRNGMKKPATATLAAVICAPLNAGW
jgi:hypothetical protein